MEYLELASFIMTILTIIIIYNLNSTKILRDYLDSLFLIDIIYNKLETDKRIVVKFLKLGSRFFQFCYIFFITESFYLIILEAFTLNLLSLIALPVLILSIVIIPFMVRILLKFQFIVHGIRVDSN